MERNTRIKPNVPRVSKTSAAPIRVLHLAYSIKRGGAGAAALTLHTALLDIGVDSVLMSFDATDVPSTVPVYSRFLDSFLRFKHWVFGPARYLIFRRLGGFHSFGLLPSFLTRRLRNIAPDIIHVHWIGAEMIRLDELVKVSTPIVWTLHDLWLLNATEHFPVRSEPSISTTIIKLSPFLQWLRHASKQLKEDFAESLGDSLAIVYPAQWMNIMRFRLIEQRPLKGTVIGNAISLPVHNKKSLSAQGLQVIEHVRQQAGDRLIVLAVANNFARDPRKGYDLLMEAFALLLQRSPGPTFLLVTIGTPPSVEPNHLSLGHIQERAVIDQLMHVASVLACPSRVEVLPTIVLECLAVGTPVVGFHVDGVAELLNEGRGRTVTAFSTAEFAVAIELAVCECSPAQKAMRISFVQNNFSTVQVARRHECLYKSLVRSGEETTQ